MLQPIARARYACAGAEAQAHYSHLLRHDENLCLRSFPGAEKVSFSGGACRRWWLRRACRGASIYHCVRQPGDMDRADAVMAPEVALEGKQWSYMTGGGSGVDLQWLFVGVRGLACD